MLCRIDLPLNECDLKFAKDDSGVFEGYAAVYNNVDSDRDTIMKGAFATTVADGCTVPIFYGHGWRQGAMPVGKSQRFAEDDHGLHMKANFTLGSAGGRDSYALVKDGVMTGLSVGMLIAKDGATRKESGGRIIKSAGLLEVSVLPFPSNPEALVSEVKTAIDEIETIADIEVMLREAGFSRSAARHLIGKLKKLTVDDNAGELESLKLKLKHSLSGESRKSRLRLISKNLDLDRR